MNNMEIREAEIQSELPAVLSAPENANQGLAVAENQSLSDPGSSRESEDALDQMKALAPQAVQKLQQMLNSETTKPATVLRVCEMILDRAYGKPDSSIRVTSVTQTVEQSRELVFSLVETVRAFQMPVKEKDDMSILKSVVMEEKGGEENDQNRASGEDGRLDEAGAVI